jgi:hypothetical protein
MDKQFVSTGTSPTVVLEVHGNLRIKGSDEEQVTAKSSSPEQLSIEQNENTVRVQCMTDCQVRVPSDATIQIEAAYGNALLKALDGDVKIEAIHGNLEMRGVADTTIEHVYGELTAKNVAGDLSIGSVDGNATVRDIQGTFSVSGAVSGNLRLDDVDGDASASADGNIVLRLDPVPGQSYTFNAGGDIFCRLPDEASAEVSIPNASQVIVHLPDAETSAPVKTPYTMTLGEGDANLTLSAEGNVVLESYAHDFSDIGPIDIEIGKEMEGMGDAFGQQLEAQIEAQMAAMVQQLESQFTSLSLRLGASKMSEEQARHIEERARAASERATAHAQERLRHAQEKMEQKVAAAQRRAEQKARTAERASRRGRQSWSFGMPPVPPSPSAPVEPVSEEERLMILRMLEQKKVSLQEAEELLAALEGK